MLSANPIPGAVVQQQAAQHTGLRFNGVGRNAQLRDLVVLAVAVVYGRKHG